MSALRIVGPASELEPSQRYCTCCERRLTNKVAWLERHTTKGFYSDRGDIPEEYSQGWFPFGLACAEKMNGKVNRD